MGRNVQDGPLREGPHPVVISRNKLKTFENHSVSGDRLPGVLSQSLISVEDLDPLVSADRRLDGYAPGKGPHVAGELDENFSTSCLDPLDLLVLDFAYGGDAHVRQLLDYGRVVHVGRNGGQVYQQVGVGHAHGVVLSPVHLEPRVQAFPGRFRGGKGDLVTVALSDQGHNGVFPVLLGVDRFQDLGQFFDGRSQVLHEDGPFQNVLVVVLSRFTTFLLLLLLFAVRHVLELLFVCCKRKSPKRKEEEEFREITFFVLFFSPTRTISARKTKAHSFPNLVNRKD